MGNLWPTKCCWELYGSLTTYEGKQVHHPLPKETLADYSINHLPNYYLLTISLTTE